MDQVNHAKDLAHQRSRPSQIKAERWSEWVEPDLLCLMTLLISLKLNVDIALQLKLETIDLWQKKVSAAASPNRNPKGCYPNSEQQAVWARPHRLFGR
jgi:hypothetical protein